ncbi:class I SAM-dependent methyltransferase [Candidatus Woesearchaeota archaeon]|nr:class I SAM-dependent methyltransferase [Candidatus Woesearchaeota archaeon]
MEGRDNKSLKDKYDEVYKKGKESFFTFDSLDISGAVLQEDGWKGKQVLEIGCGTGETAIQIAEAGAESVLATDYSKEAIKIAEEMHKHPKLKFECKGIEELDGKYDVVVMQEVLEHTDDPFAVLKSLKGFMKEDSKLIVTCPNFTNIRGYIWMSLQLLLNVPMSLSDVHFLCPFNIQEWADELGLKLKWRTIGYDKANGEKMIIDMRKRLTNALRDAKLDNTNVEKLLAWLSEVIKYDHGLPFAGVTGVYVLTK